MTGHSGEGKGSDRTLREVRSDRTLRGGKWGVTGHSGEGKGGDRTLRGGKWGVTGHSGK